VLFIKIVNCPHIFKVFHIIMLLLLKLKKKLNIEPHTFLRMIKFQIFIIGIIYINGRHDKFYLFLGTREPKKFGL